MRHVLSPGLVVAAFVVTATDARAQTPVTPEPGQPNTASVATVASGFDWNYTAPVLGGSSVTVTYDPAAGTLAFDAIDVRLGPASMCVGVHFCRCFYEQRLHLLPGARPLADVSADGRFTLAHPAVYEGRVGGYPCLTWPHAPVEVTWQATGTVFLDVASGRLRLSAMEVAVDGVGEPAVWYVDTAALTLNFVSGFSAYVPSRRLQEVGAPLVVTGGEFTPGTVAKVFVSTPEGPRDVIPEGLRPTAVTPLRWEGQLPWPWPVPPPGDSDQAFGYVSVHLVRTDRGYDRSNEIPALLAGSLDRGVVGLTGLDVAPSATSWDPLVAVPNVEKVYAPGASLYAGGTFPNPAATVINVFGAGGNCAPPGGVRPAAVGATWLAFEVPADCPVGPGAFQAVDTVTGLASGIVSAPIGEPIDVSAVTIGGTAVTVTGTGFNERTVLNFFARDAGGAIANFGGFDEAGRQRLPVTVVDAHALSFELPPTAASGACFVEALNPPFIDYTSSRTRPPGGDCTIP